MDDRKADIGKADFVRVDKSERRLELLRKDRVIATYNIALGRSPVGDKEQRRRHAHAGRTLCDRLA